MLFETFRQENQNTLLVKLSDDSGYESLLIMPANSPLASTMSRTHLMTVFGALAALCIVAGIVPMPLDPLVLYMVIHNFDVRCLNRDIVGQWNMTLRNVLDSWKSLRAGRDSLQPFQVVLANLFEREVGTLNSGFVHVALLTLLPAL
jgi:hypothetical protein